MAQKERQLVLSWVVKARSSPWNGKWGKAEGKNIESGRELKGVEQIIHMLESYLGSGDTWPQHCWKWLFSPGMLKGLCGLRTKPNKKAAWAKSILIRMLWVIAGAVFEFSFCFSWPSQQFSYYIAGAPFVLCYHVPGTWLCSGLWWLALLRCYHAWWVEQLLIIGLCCTSNFSELPAPAAPSLLTVSHFGSLCICQGFCSYSAEVIKYKWGMWPCLQSGSQLSQFSSTLWVRWLQVRIVSLPFIYMEQITHSNLLVWKASYLKCSSNLGPQSPFYCVLSHRPPHLPFPRIWLPCL